MASFIPLESQLKKEGFKAIAGIDEAGRGPLAGPVVCAAVILKPRMRLPGLNDSKQVSPKNRERLFKLITENAQYYAITIVSHLVIDDINISNAVKFANQLCAQHLEPTPDYVLLDGRDKQWIKLRHRNIIKGDQKIRSIAAASILAKVTRDKIMEYYAKIYPEYGFEQHMGYGTRKHRTNMLKYGPCTIHRKSYSFKK